MNGREREDSRIANHLAGALSYLAARDLRALSNRQRRERARLIRELEAYRRTGRFPRNRDFPGRRVPYFVDAEGVSCAVAHLVRVSGGAKLVDAVHETRNNALVVDLVPELAEFLACAGLSWQEAARIQPGYWVPVEAPAAAWICQTPDGVTPAVGFTGRIVEDRAERVIDLVDRVAPGDRRVSYRYEPPRQHIEVDRVFGDAKALPSRSLEAAGQSIEATGLLHSGRRIYALVYRVYEQGLPQKAEIEQLKEPFVRDGVSMSIDEYLRLRLSDDCTDRMRARFPTLGRFVARGVPAGAAGDWDAWVSHGVRPPRLAPGEPLPIAGEMKMRIVMLSAFRGARDAPTTDDGLGPPPAQDMFLFSKAAATPSHDAGPMSDPKAIEPAEPNHHSRWAAGLATVLALPLGFFGWFIARRRRAQ